MWPPIHSPYTGLQHTAREGATAHLSPWGPINDSDLAAARGASCHRMDGRTRMGQTEGRDGQMGQTNGRGGQMDGARNRTTHLMLLCMTPQLDTNRLMYHKE